MKLAQLSVHEIRGVARRRRKWLILPSLLVTILCVTGALILPRKYESSTTILVQRDEVLNPLISYEMAVAMASEDRLRTFNEIIYSKVTIQVLIDSLQLGAEIETEAERQKLTKKVREHIRTYRPGANSFRITFIDTDPVRSQHGASLLANHFIRTILKVENQRNEQAVQFFEKKLEEFRLKFEESQKVLVPLVQQRIAEMPLADRAVYTQIEELDEQIYAIENRLKAYQQALVILKTFPGALHTPGGRQVLFELQRTDLPYVADLQPLLTKYEEYVSVRKFTARYPEVARLESQILSLVDRISKTVVSETPKQRNLRQELENRRSQFVGSLTQASVAQQIDQDKESTHGIYRKLYDEMKVKLEQARTARDLGRKGEEQFMIIDPPVIPKEASRPNRLLIILGGGLLGLLLGVLSAAAAELLDTTIRITEDLGNYHKPVIAFISDRQPG